MSGQCPKCLMYSGDDWRQCGGSCPMPMSPHYKPYPATTPEPAPVRTDSPAVWPIVIADVPYLLSEMPESVRARLVADMHLRDKFGREKYGVPLQVENGREHPSDAYQEALDGAAYSRGEFEKTKKPAWMAIHQAFVRLAACIAEQIMQTEER